MFDVAPTELLLVAVVALLVIGPKDLPKAMRVVGKWVAKARGIARQFRSGLDTMIRESELAEMEKQWATENERIMREFPATPALPSPVTPAADAIIDAEPVMTAQPEILPAVEEPAPAPTKRRARPKAAIAEAPATGDLIEAPEPAVPKPRKPRSKKPS